MEDRLIRLEGTYNFRDFGGYETADGRRVKRQRLYRSDSLARLSRRAFDRFSSLGIRLLVDFRSEAERRLRPNVLPPGGDLRVEHLPVSIAPELERKWSRLGAIWFLVSGRMNRFDREFMLGIYRRIAQTAAPALSRLFRLLVDPASYPVLLLCAGGRDRTGFGAAMVLSALGVPPEMVVSDYHLTHVYTAEPVERVVKALRLLSLFRLSADRLRGFMQARSEYLRVAFQSVRARYGSVDAYLQGEIGLGDADRQALRSLLLESEVSVETLKPRCPAPVLALPPESLART
jgi:protein-tyrosine phosphatase